MSRRNIANPRTPVCRDADTSPPTTSYRHRVTA
jgi:hypothetical protein